MSENSNPHPSWCVLISMDGDQFSASFGDFENIQESLVAFGSTPLEAVLKLTEDTKRQLDEAPIAISNSRLLDFVKLARLFRNTEIVDDDFTKIRDKFDSMMYKLLKELNNELEPS